MLIATQLETSLADGEQGAATLARAVAEQTSNSVQAVDLTVREIAGRLMGEGAKEPGGGLALLGSRSTFELLVDKLKGVGQAAALFVVGADGRQISSSRGFPAVPVDASERDYFRHFKAFDDREAFVSAPVKSQVTGLWTVFLARRLSTADGAFGGAVVAAVSLSSLEQFYRAVTPQDWSITLLRRDGTILVRYPLFEAEIGKTLAVESPWYRALADNGGPYRSPGYIDGERRLVWVHPLRDFPLVIDATTTEAAMLAAWQRHAAWILAVAAFAIAGVVVLLRVFGLQMSRLEKSEAGMARQNLQLARQNKQLESGRTRFDAVLENISQGLTFFDAEQNLMVSNRRYAEIYRLSPEQTRIGTSLLDVLRSRRAAATFVSMTEEAYLARREALSRAGEPYDVTDELIDGRIVAMHYQPLPDGGWVTTHEDITERRRTESSLAFMARHDALTELPNRTLFQERLEQAIPATGQGGNSALLCLDLDRFKVINDTLGHPVGDGLLRAVAGRLRNAVKSGDTVARLGGDEFAIVQVGLGDPTEAGLLAARIIEAIRRPFDIDGHRVVCGMSVGIAIAPRDGTAPEALQKHADVALYLAKTQGRGAYRYFEPQMDARVHELRLIELDLRNARPAEDFELHYQPVVDLWSGMLTGFEALLRWNHPMRGLVPPDAFIPIAEETGLIVPIGAWALRQACAEAASWPGNLEIAVNLSAVQFNSASLFDAVRDALLASGLAPNRLELEITESVLLQNSDDRLAMLHQFRALGIRIALDDFGTGYSSLSYLRGFPFDKIKIDRSFIRDVDTNQDSNLIVGAIVSLARNLGMVSVAEGVETPQQLATLRDHGCRKVQGHLFSKPCPGGEVPALIRRLANSEHLQPDRRSLVATLASARAGREDGRLAVAAGQGPTGQSENLLIG